MNWRGRTDVLIAMLVVVLAGFIAAFVARNSDQWLHYAAGRDLLSGKYSLGSDPYSYVAAPRVWVNASWLYDLGAYGLYSLDNNGSVVIAVKAAAVALAFAIGFFVRKPGQPLWAWWFIAAIAAVAAAPHTALRPLVASALGTSIALYLLFGRQWTKGAWSNPLLLALLTALWANLDHWFLLCPVLVAVVLLAEVLQRLLLKSETPDPTAPAVADLAKALLLCLLATLANPHHVRIWQLPVELGLNLPPGLREDGAISGLWLSPLTAHYRDKAEYGRNLNGAAFAVLLLIGGGLLALGVARVRLAYLFAWVLFSLLALVQHRLILLFAVASVPLVAGPLAELATKYAAKAPPVLSTLLRVLGLAAVLLLLACAWPGWLHPKPSDPAYANRVALGCEPDPAYARTAKWLEESRTSGKLRDDQRGYVLALELANHVAWFAPHETVAINGRYGHHLPDLAGWQALRKAFAGDPDPKNAELLQSHGASYAVFSMTPGGNLLEHVQRSIDHGSDPNFALWHFDGRTAVLGLSRIPNLRFDPEKLAFSLNQPPLPEPVLASPPPQTHEPLEDFLVAPKPLPMEALDAMAYQMYAAFAWKSSETRHLQSVAQATMALGGGPAALEMLNRGALPAAQIPDRAVALNLLAQRAARQAMAANPDHPLAYYALAQCLWPEESPLPGFADADLALARATNWRRFLARIPPPETIKVGLELTFAVPAANRLAKYCADNHMADYARDARKLALEYGRRRAPLMHRDHPEDLKKELEQIDKEIAGRNENHAARLEKLQTLAGRPPGERMMAARQLELPGEELKIIQSADFGPNALLVEMRAIQIRLQAGFLEDAAVAMTALQEKLKSQPKVDPQIASGLSNLLAEAQRLSGDFGAYRQWLDANHYPHPPLTHAQIELIQRVSGSADSLGLRANGMLHATLGGGLVLLERAANDGIVLQNWLAESAHEFRRGQACLLEGRMAEARASFARAINPLGQPLPAYIPTRAAAERYIRLIDSAK